MVDDDLLQRRVDEARADLEKHVAPSPPDFSVVRRAALTRHRALVAITCAVLLVMGAVSIFAWPERRQVSVIAGPSFTGDNSDLLGPGETRRLSSSPLAGRSTMASVWTGTEMLIWGGDGPGGARSDGAAYNPRRDTWRMLPDGPLTARNAPAAVWTGKEMLLWGGHSKTVDHRDGAAFDPVKGTWRSIAAAPMRSAGRPTAVWTGTEMLVLAGFNGHNGAAYDPINDTWRSLPDLPGQPQAPTPAVVWTGSRLIAALGYPDGKGSGVFSFDPTTEEWTELPRFDKSEIQLAWTGDRLLAVSRRLAVVLDSTTGQWISVAQAPNDDNLGDPVSAWTGTESLLWGGGETAFIIDPARRTWQTTPAGGLGQREQPAAVWADGVFLAWGGSGKANGVMLHPRTARPDNAALRAHAGID